MTGYHALLIASAPTGLLACGMFPESWANRHIQWMRNMALAVSTWALLAAIFATAFLIFLGPSDFTFLSFGSRFKLDLGVYFDNLSATMLLLVSLIGLIIIRYTMRYLDGERTQGRFIKWISISLGAVMVLIVSNNLVMFTAAWMLTSFGLHKLLTHYADRPSAILAARKKFLISRLGDCLLLLALVITYLAVGSSEYSQVFAFAQSVKDGTTEGSWLLQFAGLLYVCGAITKSAQFPFHSWLPDTMETPTPVSAFMHAGIINAGGFLVIRLSPLISLSSLSLDFLAIVGAATALIGATIMLTQTSVKRSLAYSTMAQMGFMMLQCGLGAFSTALLHIVGHSLYKAHAFLSSGSVLQAAASQKLDGKINARGSRPYATLILSAIFSIAICFLAAWGLGSLTASKPGALLLGFVLTLAITQLLWKCMESNRLTVVASGIAAAIVISFAYFGTAKLFDLLLASSVSYSVVALSTADQILIALVATGFLLVFVLQVGLTRTASNAWLKKLYVHASNGFYFDIPAQKLTVKLWNRFSAPGQIAQ